MESKEQNETSSNWMQVLAKSVIIAGELNLLLPWEKEADHWQT